MNRTAIEVLILLAACLLAVSGVWGQAPGVGVDAAGTYWFYDWIKYSLVQGVSPFWTAQFYHPHGQNLLATTGYNFVDAYFSVPLQLLLGFPNYLMPFIALIFLGNALAMRALLRALGMSRVAAVAGALVFALHPYIIFEVNNGRLTQAMLWFWPLALREILLMRTDPRWRRPVLAGTFLALQAWTYWYTGHFLLLVGLPALALLGRHLGRGWWVRLALTGGICLALVAPGIVLMLHKAAQGEVPGVGSSADQVWFSAMAAAVRAWTLFDQHEDVVHVALPSLVASAIVLLVSRHRAALVSTATLALLVAAGPMLVSGQDHVPNQFWSGAELLLPGLGRLLYPYRIWAVLALLLAVALALCLEEWIRHPVKRACAAAALVAMIIWPSSPGLPLVKGRTIRVPSYIEAVRRAPGPVLDLPFPCTDEVTYYQFLHGQPLVAGLGQKLPAFHPPGLLGRLRGDPLLADAMLASRGIRPSGLHGSHTPRRGVARWLVLHTGAYQRSTYMIHCLGWMNDPVDPGALGRAGQVMENFLGPPSAKDAEASAWDLWRLAPGYPKY